MGRMPYLVDRQRVLRVEDVVAIVKRRERPRSRVILADNSLYQTRTRPATLMRRAKDYPDSLKGARWRTPK